MTCKTRLLQCDARKISFRRCKDDTGNGNDDRLAALEDPILEASDDTLQVLREAAHELISPDLQQIVAIPTETVYGLAADALNDFAVQRIFQVKQRPSDNPLIVHVSSLRMMRELCCLNQHIPPVYLPLIAKYWPGPLTILVPKSSLFPASVSGMSPSVTTVGVRFPSHPIARALISIAGTPLAAPSANLSGRPSPTTAQHVVFDLDGLIPVVLSDVSESASTCNIGLESTVIDALRVPPVILRPGAITLEMVRSVPGFADTVAYSKSESFSEGAQELVPTTPGMKYRHYSPTNAIVTLFESDSSLTTLDSLEFYRLVEMEILKIRLQNPEATFGIVHSVNLNLPLTKPILETDEYQICAYQLVSSAAQGLALRPATANEGVHIYNFSITQDDDDASFGRTLFHALRWMDEKVDHILIRGVSEQNLGMAIMNRLRKSATFLKLE